MKIIIQETVTRQSSEKKDQETTGSVGKNDFNDCASQWGKLIRHEKLEFLKNMIKTGHICLDILLSDYHCKISGIVLNENYYIAILRFFRHIENQISMFLYSK